MQIIQHTLFSDFDINLFSAGKHFRLYEKLGSHVIEVDGQKGTYFAVWAPNARQVSLVGNFNQWDKSAHPLFNRFDGSGIWEGFVPGIGHGQLYKYSVQGPAGQWMDKGDPFAKLWEIPPNTSTVIWDASYEWKDEKWLAARAKKDKKAQPYSVYEVHMGSWRKRLGGAESLSYREMATEMVEYVKGMGFSHVEFMPVMEHPYYPSWGYQGTGYFATTSRFGLPEDFKFLVDAFHEAEIGVILDWVPSHFPTDAHGLAYFDGTHLFEHADPRKGFHPDWKSYIFNYGRFEVRSFLISNALYWVEQYHADGLRVDAVASMLYLDYSRNEGEWIPNEYGGRENLEAISFLQEMNQEVHRNFPDVVTIAEESTSFTGVSHPVEDGGLGFDQKWMMGWMHDTLNYLKHDPIHRKYHHNEITFSLVYAFTEHFMLPLSHDEVVHGKGSLLGRMPGDEWKKFANLRLLFGYMWTHPGGKLVYMGGEFGQYEEWSHTRGLDWHMLQYDPNQQLQSWVKALNKLYKEEPALYRLQFSGDGFEWIDLSNYQNSVLVYLRKGNAQDKPLLVVCHFTPIVIPVYELGVPVGGEWEEILSSDDAIYGGSGVTNGTIKAIPAEKHDRDFSISIKVAPLSVQIFTPTVWPAPTKKSKANKSVATEIKTPKKSSTKTTTKKASPKK